MSKFPRLFFAYDDASASTLYRLVMPAEALARAGYPVAHGHIADVPDRVLMQYDTIIVSRVGSGLAQVLESIDGLHQLGKQVFIDYDDDMLHIAPHNPAYGVETDVVRSIVQPADGLVVTNSVLASVFREFNRNIAIVPNYVNAKAWPAPQKREGLTIGLMGSPSHSEDWEIVAEPMERIREKYPDVKFLVVGFLPDYLKDLATEYVDWVDIHRYPALVNRIDIGLCPLIDDAFNRAKSPIKALEYGMAGAAVVASPTQYLSVVKGRGTIARSSEEWYAGIERYIVDTEKRHRDAEALRRYVLKQDVDLHVKDIAAAYVGMCREQCIRRDSASY